MTRPTLEIVSEDTGLYAVARDAGETLGVIGPLDVDHVDLPEQERSDA